MALGAPRWRGVLSIYIGIAWASALLVLTLTGNAKAYMRGTSDKHDSHAFFMSGRKRTRHIIDMKNVFFNLLLFLIWNSFFACAEDAPTTISVKKTDTNSQVKIVQSLPTVDVYLENSGSMYGYVNGQGFKDIVYNYLSNIKVAQINNALRNMNLYYINSNVFPQQNDLDKFIKTLNVNEFRRLGGNGASTDIADLLKCVLERTSKEKVSILVSDFIFSPGSGKNAGMYLTNQQNAIKIHVAEKLRTSKDFAICIYKFESNFKGTYYNKEDHPSQINENRPFYIWVMGNKDMIRKLKNSVPDDRFGSGLMASFILEPMNQDLKSSCNANGELIIQTSKLLQNKDYLMDTSNYSIVNKSIKINSLMVNNNGNVVMRLSKDLSIQLNSECVLMAKVPQWIRDSNDSNGNRAVLHKTYGFNYLIDGIYQAYTYGSSDYFKLRFNY